MALDINQMRAEALEFCLEAERRFPGMNKKAIGKFAQFTVMASHAMRECEEHLGPDHTLSEKGIEFVLKECLAYVTEKTPKTRKGQKS